MIGSLIGGVFVCLVVGAIVLLSLASRPSATKQDKLDAANRRLPW